LADETPVTIAAARFIGSIGWKTISIALPRGGSGLSFVGDDGQSPTIIPDVAAFNAKRNKYLLIEAKPNFSDSDVKKLLNVKEGRYSNAITTILNCEISQVFVGVAFGGANLMLDPSELGMDFVLYYNAEGKIEILHDGVELGI